MNDNTYYLLLGMAYQAETAHLEKLQKEEIQINILYCPFLFNYTIAITFLK